MPATRLQAIQSLATESALVDVVAALGRSEVTPLYFKGLAITRWLYDLPNERRFRDFDLLVAPEQHAQAARALTHAGYTERRGLDGEFSPHATMWTADGPLRAAVHLHRAPLLLLERDHSAVWRTLVKGAQILEIAGVRIPVPGIPAHSVIVTLHAAQHGRNSSKCLEDLRRAVQRVSEEDWRAAAAIARELDAEQAFAAGLRMLPAGVELADRLQLTTRLGARLRLYRHNRTTTWVALARLAAISSRRERARALIRALFPSSSFLRVAEPLAGRGKLGLALAYGLRPLRLLVRAPGGYLAWRAVARDEQIRPADGSRTGVDAARRAWWAVHALRACRTQLRQGGLAELRLPDPPRCRTEGERGIERALGLGRASCLERSVIRQRWYQSRGDDRDLVLGVTAPSNGFRAHAWLDGDPQFETALTEILRRPPGQST